MRFLIILFLVVSSSNLFAQKHQVKCDSITCDYLVKIEVVYPDSVVTGDCIKMIKETMVVVLYDQTPKHKANFIKLAQAGFYNGTTFHRIIDGFMIQGGDPNSKDSNPYNDGQGGPGYTIPAEIQPGLSHKKGALSSARMGDHVNPDRESNGSQFFIVQNNGGTPHLDGGYTVFGQVIKGLDVVDHVVKVKKGASDRPIYDVKMTVTVEQIPRKKITELYGYHY